MSMMNCVRLYRLEKLESLTEDHHRKLDNMILDSMVLVRTASIMPPKKQVNFAVDNLISGIKFKLEQIVPLKERTPMNPLYSSTVVFLAYSHVILEKYVH